MRLSRLQLLAGLLALVVVVAVVAGIVVVGSPAEQRTQQLEREHEVGNLASIAQAADLYWTRHAQLPTSLNELTSEPETVSAQTTRRRTLLTSTKVTLILEVCAQFQRQSQQDWVALGQVLSYTVTDGNAFPRRRARTIPD